MYQSVLVKRNISQREKFSFILKVSIEESFHGCFSVFVIEIIMMCLFQFMKFLSFNLAISKQYARINQ